MNIIFLRDRGFANTPVWKQKRNPRGIELSIHQRQIPNDKQSQHKQKQKKQKEGTVHALSNEINQKVFNGALQQMDEENPQSERQFF